MTTIEYDLDTSGGLMEVRNAGNFNRVAMLNFSSQAGLHSN